MDSTDIAWLAGLLEGEGYFYSRNAGVDHYGRQYLYPAITLGMTDEDVVKRAAILFGNVKCSIAQITKGGKNFYRCVISGSRAAELMTKLLPYMGIRRSKKIQDILESYGNRDRTNNTRGTNTWKIRKLRKEETPP